MTTKLYDDVIIDRFWKAVEVVDGGCWNWKRAKSKAGYGQLKVDKILYAHRISWELYHGEKIPPRMEILHTCDNPSCVSPHHLVLGTHRENMADAKTKNRMAHGEKLPQAKLTIRQITEIRELYSDGFKQSELALRYNVDPSTISYIITGRNWKWLA